MNAIHGKETNVKYITKLLCLLLVVAQLLPMIVCAEEISLPVEETIAVNEQETEPVTRRSIASMPQYYQNDYPDVRYGAGTIATSGCGITCVAMVATWLTGYDYKPDVLAGYFGGRAENNIARLECACDALQLPYEKSENWQKTLEALHEGKIAIALMGSTSIFTNNQHFIVLTGVTEDGNVLVKDPNKDNYARWQLQNGLENGFEPGDIVCGYSGAWIFDPDAVPEIPFYYCERAYADECRYPEIHLTVVEKEILARVIWVEARGESAEGQQAVAEVVLNRMASEDYPNNLLSVIYANKQFDSVPYLGDAEPTQTQYDAIERALNGPYVLPMKVMSFASYRTGDELWGQIGGHYFFY